LTRFVVDPAGGGCRVRIATEQPPRTGPAAWVERLLVPRLLGPLSSDGLARLDDDARS